MQANGLVVREAATLPSAVHSGDSLLNSHSLIVHSGDSLLNSHSLIAQLDVAAELNWPPETLYIKSFK